MAPFYYIFKRLRFQLTHHQRGVGAAETEAIGHNGRQLTFGGFSHDVQASRLLVHLVDVDAWRDKATPAAPRE